MSNCDSDGVPTDHDGHRLEDFISDGAPFAISGDVFREIMLGKSEDLKEGHLEADPVGGSPFLHSSSGGIPIHGLDEVLVEDYASSEEPLSPRPASGSPSSATIQAVLRTSKHEREALYASRRKLADVLSFLRSKGFKEEDIFKGQIVDGFGSPVPQRDDFGLPELATTVGNPFKDKMKGKIDDAGTQQAVKTVVDASLLSKDSETGVFEVLSEPIPVVNPSVDVKHGKGEVKSSVKPSWSSVVKSGGVEESLSFDYCPMLEGAVGVTPPSEVLKKGLAKFKLCLVGNFSKGTLPLSKVIEISRKAWDSKGLCHVSQKDSHTFLFKFATAEGLNAVLARGTWCFERKPVILSAWGSDLGVGKASSMPLWVKFKNLPDYYWTREGLSCVASAIGPPICADKVTALLNPVPFAKICVRYKIGDPLPETLKVAVMDFNTLELSKDEFVDVEVSYPQRPLLCTGCKGLGHLVGACPVVKRVWVQKKNSDLDDPPAVVKDGTSPSPVIVESSVPSVAVGIDSRVSTEAAGNASNLSNEDPTKIVSDEGKVAPDSEEWTTVGGKKSNTSPVAHESFSKKLPVFTALSKTLSKGQLKRARKALGRSSPPKN